MEFFDLIIPNNIGQRACVPKTLGRPSTWPNRRPIVTPSWLIVPIL